MNGRRALYVLLGGVLTGVLLGPASARADAAADPKRHPPASSSRSHAHHPHLRPTSSTESQTGVASWYGGRRENHRTASGELLDGRQLTAAHRTLPLHSEVRVTNLTNGRSVTVRVTDRGPHRKGRIIDLSRSAAERLGMKHSGLARVRLEPISVAALSGSSD